MRLIFYNTFSNRAQFEMTEGKRPWDILLLLADGSFSITFPRLKKTVIVEQDQAVFIPANEEFTRTVLTPIHFHQFAFLHDTNQPFYEAMIPGTLSIPKPQIAAALTDMERIAVMPNHNALLLHTVEHLFAEQWIFSDTGKDNPQNLSDDIMAVLHYMNERLEQKISIQELADLVHLSHNGLLWKFHLQLGTTPSQYLIRLRLRYAKQLLLEGQLRVNEIALRCGYTNAYYFSNSFRQRYGMSPIEFRKHYLK